MEFLDPVAKKKKTRRLFIGYGLVTVLIALATYVMVATAIGYEVFDFGGEVVQNGIVFIDTKPVSAAVTINGKLEKDKTDSKLILNGGEYIVTLNETGYTSWTKKIAIDGGKVRFFSYPWLFPATITPSKQADLPINTGFTTQSTDSRWLVIQQNASIPAIEIFDLEETKLVAKSVVFPQSILSNVGGNYGSFEVVSWADDNQHFLLCQKLPDGKRKYLLIDRENIDLSVNLNTVFGVEPTNVKLFDNQSTKFYMYFATGGLLRVADLEAKNVAEPILDQVLAFQTKGTDLILYATTKDANPGKVAVKIHRDSDNFAFTELDFDSGNNYFLEFESFNNSWYYAVGSGVSSQVQIYRNPLNFITAKKPKPAALLTTLKAGVPSSLSFSPQNSRFILVRSGQTVADYDAEEDKSYKYDLPFATDAGSKITWVDGFHLQGVAGGKLQVFEFDGQNNRELLSVRNMTPGYFSKDYKKLFSISPTDTASTLDVTGLVVPKN
jgi:hypothetical protein